jgi:alkanesulfonate monooxygenase SsuD/methylene tetrahydromethanopterin reductase-like flavin-dependent oxidoreductase (luciferase family)
MEVGVLFVFQNFMDQMSDAEAYRRDIDIAERVEPLGYDFISAVEHHFFSYAFQPDNMQFLSYIAAKTQRIGLLPGAVILPWNNPLRVVEKMILLDHLSNGRAILGIGRGLARREYVRFGIDMNEARDRFDEAAGIIVRGLETGIVEGKGPYYPYEPTEIRPRPLRSFRDRFNCVAMSTDSVPICARLGGKLMSFAIKPWDQMAPYFNTYRDLFLEHHGREAPAPMCVESMCCDESSDRAEALAREHIANYYMTVMDHYDLAGEHFRGMKGYGDYASNAALLREAGLESGAEMYVQANIWGTPNQILEKLDKRRAYLGDFDLMVSPTFGGLSERDARNNLELFGKKVLPELQSWKRAA